MGSPLICHLICWTSCVFYTSFVLSGIRWVRCMFYKCIPLSIWKPFKYGIRFHLFGVIYKSSHVHNGTDKKIRANLGFFYLGVWSWNCFRSCGGMMTEISDYACYIVIVWLTVIEFGFFDLVFISCSYAESISHFFIYTKVASLIVVVLIIIK